ncbi:Signal peptidase protein [Spraguea lophii 42_110]|uniref:Signal peptidase complex subunit 3 n=1 Tax=Spraguea lophii (strain 42_110) TaxID=1358809 RepID=S7XSA1_SPRLO|nr:Signal peptidase protein [Spraguea lophii 42_110]
MNTFSKRISHILNYTFYATIVLLILIYMSSLWYKRSTPTSNLTIKELSALTFPKLVFNPDIDLSNQFNFNTKQIFVYLKMIYGPSNKYSEMVWSKIIKADDNKLLKNDIYNNYKFSKEVRYFQNVTFELRGSILEYVGRNYDMLIKRIVYDNKEI